MASARVRVTKVRIAPIEQWCWWLKEKMAAFPELDFHKQEGLWIEIDTFSMQSGAPCGANFKAWRVIPDSVRRMDAAIGYYGRPRKQVVWKSCEHMLEMD